MIKIPMSRAAAGLLRALRDRAGIAGNRILLTEIRSREWQSLTFAGERHSISLRVPGPEAESIVRALTHELEDAEFAIPGQIVADIAVPVPPSREPDGALCVEIEALTIAE